MCLSHLAGHSRANVRLLCRVRKRKPTAKKAPLQPLWQQLVLSLSSSTEALVQRACRTAARRRLPPRPPPLSCAAGPRRFVSPRQQRDSNGHPSQSTLLPSSSSSSTVTSTLALSSSTSTSSSMRAAATPMTITKGQRTTRMTNCTALRAAVPTRLLGSSSPARSQQSLPLHQSHLRARPPPPPQQHRQQQRPRLHQPRRTSLRPGRGGMSASRPSGRRPPRRSPS